MARTDRNAAMIETAIERLEEVRPTLAAVDGRLREWSLGVTAAGGGIRSKGSHSDPAGAAAVRLLEGSADKFAQDRNRVDRLVSEIARTTSELARLVADVMAPPLPKEPEDRGLVACANAHSCPAEAWAAPGRRGRCEACYRYLLRHDRDRRAIGGARGGSDDGE